MRKRVSTRLYTAAWVVWLVALLTFAMTANVVRSGSTVVAAGTTPLATTAWIIAFIAGLVMLVTWVGALIRLAQQRRWGWFLAVCATHLAMLGIFGMVAYALGGPDDQLDEADVPSRIKVWRGRSSTY